MKKSHTFKSGDAVTTKFLHDNAEALRELQNNCIEFCQPPLRKVGTTLMFDAKIDKPILCSIKNGGPQSEADYTDYRYWVCEAQCTTTTTVETSEVEFDDKTDANYYTAINLMEYDYESESDEHTHLVPVDKLVLVYKITDAGGTSRYVFSGLPAGEGQYKVLQLDEDNIPYWDYLRFAGAEE